MAVENELDRWQRLGRLGELEPALRLKATLERLLRTADAYCSAWLNEAAGHSAALGAGLGIENRISKARECTSVMLYSSCCLAVEFLSSTRNC